jgi:uncharacterized membrane protein YjjB (DUF3815 family)
MRWLWFVLSTLCFAVAFRTHSMGLAALTLLGALGFLLMGTLAMAASRIETRTRDASVLMGPAEVSRLAEIERRKREAATAAAAAVPLAAGGAERDEADLDSVADGAGDND